MFVALAPPAAEHRPQATLEDLRQFLDVDFIDLRGKSASQIDNDRIASARRTQIVKPQRPARRIDHTLRDRAFDRGLPGQHLFKAIGADANQLGERRRRRPGLAKVGTQRFHAIRLAEIR